MASLTPFLTVSVHKKASKENLENLYLLSKIYHKNKNHSQNSHELAFEKPLFQKKPLGRRWYLISSFARSETANLVPLRLERSESAASLE